MFAKIIAVGMGGFVGCTLRYLIGIATTLLFPYALLPVGTLIANVIGCFCIGLLSAYAENHYTLSPTMTAMLFTGVLGGLTTFSSFGLETVQLFKNQHAIYGMMNICLQLMLGLMMVWLGYQLMEKLLA